LGRNCESRSGNIATRPRTGPAESRLRVQAGQPRGPQGSGTDGLERGPDVRPLHAVQARVIPAVGFPPADSSRRASTLSTNRRAGPLLVGWIACAITPQHDTDGPDEWIGMERKGTTPKASLATPARALRPTSRSSPSSASRGTE
jgi:hypothetical protein